MALLGQALDALQSETHAELATGGAAAAGAGAHVADAGAGRAPCDDGDDGDDDGSRRSEASCDSADEAMPGLRRRREGGADAEDEGLGGVEYYDSDGAGSEGAGSEVASAEGPRGVTTPTSEALGRAHGAVVGGALSKQALARLTPAMLAARGNAELATAAAYDGGGGYDGDGYAAGEGFEAAITDDEDDEGYDIDGGEGEGARPRVAEKNATLSDLSEEAQRRLWSSVAAGADASGGGGAAGAVGHEGGVDVQGTALDGGAHHGATPADAHYGHEYADQGWQQSPPSGYFDADLRHAAEAYDAARVTMALLEARATNAYGAQACAGGGTTTPYREYGAAPQYDPVGAHQGGCTGVLYAPPPPLRPPNAPTPAPGAAAATASAATASAATASAASATPAAACHAVAAPSSGGASIAATAASDAEVLALREELATARRQLAASEGVVAMCVAPERGEQMPPPAAPCRS